ncbi:MAG TPA: hypothetical protein VGC20_01385 [bacterium]|jgi:hypothetical protein
MRSDGILMEDRCERCSSLMNVRTMSYFSEEVICEGCLAEERSLIARLRLRGIDPATLAGCGYLPFEDDPGDVRPPMPA